ncbi:MAG TPA: HlyD family efflux transporter periplasmic adaptor subunit [Anaerolineales bacterium]|nr:HlyD family efflux transporter periplasmic adaptor subunit [Anaerolineales bacterium]
MKKFTLIFALLFVVSTVGCANAKSTALQASGQIEAKEIAIAPELSGRVVEVAVNEGDAVKAGDLVLRLDDSLLQFQKKAAQAALDSANAGARTAQVGLDAAQLQYDQTLSAAQAEEESTRLDQWKKSKPSEFDQPAWYFSKDERIASAQAEVDAAKAELDRVQTQLSDTEKKAGSANFLNAEKELSNARSAFEVAKAVLDKTSGASDGSNLHDFAQTNFDNAKTKLENAQKNYDDALTTEGAQDVLKARARVEVARERYNSALDALRALQTGAHSPAVASAGKALEQAKAVADQAQSAVQQAQANLDSIKAQIDKLTVRTPVDGVVLVRSIDAGEVIQAGMPAMTIGKLDTLKITVYIPEDQYGQISLGERATLKVDSFPTESFNATVTRISNQAEFTPQNVQTKEGRQTTVYAVELSVDNQNGKLKPGMPVDVAFEAGIAGK